MGWERYGTTFHPRLLTNCLGFYLNPRTLTNYSHVSSVQAAFKPGEEFKTREDIEPLKGYVQRLERSTNISVDFERMALVNMVPLLNSAFLHA